jgi:crotonobetainyl-CoA:carnitine CoA-transferase CaiB-like acyl-CoA transferase
VATVPELVADEHYRARDVIVTAERPGHDAFEQVGFVLAGMDRSQPSPTVRDATETDTDALLAAAGLSTEQIAALRSEGAVA